MLEMEIIKIKKHFVDKSYISLLESHYTVPNDPDILYTQEDIDKISNPIKRNFYAQYSYADMVRIPVEDNVINFISFGIYYRKMESKDLDDASDYARDVIRLFPSIVYYINTNTMNIIHNTELKSNKDHEIIILDDDTYIIDREYHVNFFGAIEHLSEYKDVHHFIRHKPINIFHNELR